MIIVNMSLGAIGFIILLIFGYLIIKGIIEIVKFVFNSIKSLFGKG